MMPTRSAQATLLLADISGYSGFLAAVGEAHGRELAQGDTPPAYPLMTTLLDAIVESVAPPFTLAKLEGDAVFAYADDGSLSLRGDEMHACLLDCYRAFRDHLEQTEASMTCTCEACSSVAGLDLKFVLHHGSYVAQTIAGHGELLGPDVTIAHRMLKNSVTAATGLRAYALISSPAAEHLEIRLGSGRRITLEHDGLGSLDAMVIPLPTAPKAAGATA